MTKTLKWIAVLLVLAGVVVTSWYWIKKLRTYPESTISMQDGERLFKAAVFENHDNEGIPYWIFKVLPDLYPAVFKPGYANIGFVYEPGADLPLGFNKSVRHDIEFVTHNCANCHAGSYRLSANSAPVVVMGMSNITFRRQVYDRGLEKVFTDPGFTPERVIAAIEKRTSVDPNQKPIYTEWVAKLRQRATGHLKAVGTTRDWHPAHMPGAGEGFGAAKGYAGIYDKTIGTADFPSVFEQGKRSIGHWDGISTSTLERVVGSALAIGVPGGEIDMQQMLDIDRYTRNLAPPKFAGPIDSALAGQGQTVFTANCAQCHAAGGARINTIIPLKEIGTDPHRRQSISAGFIWLLKLGTLPQPYPFQHWQTSNGYRADFLEGIWLRGSYLHNGSVPTIRDLLNPPAARPVTFWRGTNVVDLTNVGFKSDQQTPGNDFLYDTRLPGYANTGHNYGTGLPDGDKKALVEYLKTL